MNGTSDIKRVHRILKVPGFFFDWSSLKYWDPRVCLELKTSGFLSQIEALTFPAHVMSNN